MDETNLDENIPNLHFQNEHYQFPPLRMDRNSNVVVGELCM